MAIRFADKPSDIVPRKPVKVPPSEEGARADGEARFATPMDAALPVNPDAAGQLPFTDLPPAEKAERRTRAPKATTRK